MTTTNDELPAILAKSALDYFTVMCARWNEATTDMAKHMHVQELAVRLPTANGLNLTVRSQTHLELVYTVSGKIYRLVGRCGWRGQDDA
jgi:hypothetical protein